MKTNEQTASIVPIEVVSEFHRIENSLTNTDKLFFGLDKRASATDKIWAVVETMCEEYGLKGYTFMMSKNEAPMCPEQCPDCDDDDDLPDGIFTPPIEEVIFSGPATIAKFADGTKTVAKLHEGDEYDPLFGILACVLRRVTNNRGHMVDECEGMMREIAESVDSVEGLEDLLAYGVMVCDMLAVTLDAARRLDNVADAIDPKGEPRTYAFPEKPERSDDHADFLLGKMVEQISSDPAYQEMLRQEIRNLMDEGEL